MGEGQELLLHVGLVTTHAPHMCATHDKGPIYTIETGNKPTQPDVAKTHVSHNATRRPQRIIDNYSMQVHPSNVASHASRQARRMRTRYARRSLTLVRWSVGMQLAQALAEVCLAAEVGGNAG